MILLGGNTNESTPKYEEIEPAIHSFVITPFESLISELTSRKLLQKKTLKVFSEDMDLKN